MVMLQSEDVYYRPHKGGSKLFAAALKLALTLEALVGQPYQGAGQAQLIPVPLS
jgi:hypothetical protein